MHDSTLSAPRQAELHKQMLAAIILSLLVLAACVVSPIISEGDSVTYAAISQHIALTGNWGDLVYEGKDWLDKPHWPFWVTALFFRLGGVNAPMYALPGFLFHLLGGYYTYRLVRTWQGKPQALLALLLYVSTFHLLYTTSALKAEAYLTGSITAASYYWLRFDASGRTKHLLLGAVFTAMSIMTKGIFTLITAASGVVCLWLYRRQWSRFVSPRWWLALALCLVFTAPELLALYLQFDLHPEKLVFGRHGVSGIRFFLWDSQFGRFFGFGPISNSDGSPWYYLHVFLWSFLPWTGGFFAAVGSELRHFSRGTQQARDGFVFFAASFLITFVLFSATSFQLDYYTVIVFPFAIGLCSDYLWRGLQVANNRVLDGMQWAVSALVLLLPLAMAAYVNVPAIWALVLALALLLLLVVRGAGGWSRSFTVLLLPVFAVNVLFVFVTVATLAVYLQYSVAYNVKPWLAPYAGRALYVYQMDSIVAQELGIYRGLPSATAEQPADLPAAGSGALVLVRERQLPEVQGQLGPYRVIAAGNWVDHKTGTLVRQLGLAKGLIPAERMELLLLAGP